MNILITICGRGGSKGVKGKNFKEFLGFPLVFFTISAAELFKTKNKNHHIDICINSDSDELLNIADKTKVVTLIKRPEYLAQDTSPKVPVIRYSLDESEKNNNIIYDYIIDLDITSPLRTLNDINNILNITIENNYDIVFSVAESRRNPYFNMVELKDGIITKSKQSDFVARQQAPKVFDINGSIYCYNRNSLINVFKNSVFDGKCGIYEMIDTCVLDIDHERDFEMMLLIAPYFYKKYPEYKEIYDNIKNLIGE